MASGPLCLSTVGKKFLVGITGLGLSVFVLTHMLGNVLIFVGPQAYNSYSHALVSNPLLIVAELGLLSFFLGHIVLAIALTLWNWRAVRSHIWKPAGDRKKPVAQPAMTRYAVTPNGLKRTSLIQRTLWAQGIVIFVFVILHLITFKYGTHYDVTYNGVQMRDLYRLVIEVFQSPYYTLWYVVATSLLLFHLSHGLRSSIQTLGFHNPRYQDLIKRISWAYALLVGLGFIAQPVYVFFFHQG